MSHPLWLVVEALACAGCGWAAEPVLVERGSRWQCVEEAEPLSHFPFAAVRRESTKFVVGSADTDKEIMILCGFPRGQDGVSRQIQASLLNTALQLLLL